MKRRPARLFLVRHAEVAANRRMAFLGRRDDPLTAAGSRQAARLRSAFERIPVDRVISSPLLRAVDTARPIAEACGRALETDERLIEQDFGTWDGMTAAEIAARGEPDRRALRRWQADLETPPPEGESLRQVQRRMVELAEEVSAARGRIVLVSHVGPIKSLLCHVLGLAAAANRRFFLDSATVSVVDWAEPPVLRLFNAHCHLGWTGARWMTSGPQ